MIPVMVLRMIFWLLLSLLVAIVAELVSQSYAEDQEKNPHTNVRHARELALFEQTFDKSNYLVNPHRVRRLLTGMLEQVEVLFVRQADSFITEKLTISAGLWDLFASAKGVLNIIMIRLASIMAFIPAGVFIALVWIIDGLVRREVRRISGGRESALIYHVAKRSLVPSIAWATLLYLAVPWVVSPLVFFYPTILLSTTALCVMASRYKKYV